MTNLPKITSKQREIINLIARFRFLDRIQIQKFLNHKDGARINEWLKDLTEKEYLTRSYSSIFPENTKPAVYHLARNGIRYLKDQNEAKTVCKFYRENERSLSFVGSCLLLANIYLDLEERSKGEIGFIVTVKSGYPTHRLADLLSDLKPSAYIKQVRLKKSKYYFLELLSSLPPERLRQRLKKYLSFYESNEWEVETKKSFPTLLLICPDETILIYVKRYLKRKINVLDEPALIIHLSTSQKVKEFGLTGDIWQSA
ncbi:MAG: replication-relaxation family protein [bacterium]